MTTATAVESPKLSLVCSSCGYGVAVAAEPAEQLLCAMADEEPADDDARDQATELHGAPYLSR